MEPVFGNGSGALFLIPLCCSGLARMNTGDLLRQVPWSTHWHVTVMWPFGYHLDPSNNIAAADSQIAVVRGGKNHGISRPYGPYGPALFAKWAKQVEFQVWKVWLLSWVNLCLLRSTDTAEHQLLPGVLIKLIGRETGRIFYDFCVAYSRHDHGTTSWQI